MRCFFAILFVLVVGHSQAQSTNVSLNDDYYHWVDRYEIKSGRIAPELFTTVKPYKRDKLVAYVDSLKKRSEVFNSRADQFNYEYLRNDSWEWSRATTNDSRKPVLKSLFRKKSDLVFVDKPEFDLHVNPVLYLGVGTDSRLDEPLYINTRGVEIRGMVDRKVGFYTMVTDNQMRVPSFVNDYITTQGVVPHEGFWKTYKNSGVDFLHARAYIDFNLSKSIYMQFGQDRTRIGPGFRSFFQSDFAAPNLFLRTNVKVWKLNYLFQFNRMAADNRSNVPSGRYPEKYMAMHHVSINIGKRLNLGLFESVVYSPKDSVNQNTFDPSYLNPVIFMRAVEQQSGSDGDNAMVGMDFKWIVTRGLSLYGQAVLDELKISELRAGNGWWANKFSLQAGLKYIDVAGIDNLDLQLEANLVRPFTFSHNTQYASYSHYRQPIGHPLGANFTELVAILRYQPLPRLQISATGFFARKGLDGPNENWGGDILKNNKTRQQEYDNTIGQGLAQRIAYGNVVASYQVRHNVFLDVQYLFRQSQSDLPAANVNSTATSVALRWNMAARTYEF